MKMPLLKRINAASGFRVTRNRRSPSGLQVGLVKAPWLADFVLVQGNPVENVAILQEPRRLLVVMKDGRIISKSDFVPEIM